MTTAQRPPKTFAEFEKRVVGPVHDFWLTHDETRLDESARLLAAVFDSNRKKTHLLSEHLVFLRGWLSPDGGFKLSKKVLQKLNPDYKIHIRRTARSEFGPRGRRFRFGFEISATAPANVPNFTLRLMDGAGELRPMRASNHEAAFALAVLSVMPELQGSERADGEPTGYVDEASDAPVAESRASDTWLATLAYRNPAEVFELVDSVQGQRFAKDVAELLRTLPSFALWADKFAMTTAERPLHVESDLIPLVIDRPNPTSDLDIDPHWFVPALVDEGARVVARPSGRAMPRPNSDWLTPEDAIVQDGGTVITDGSLVVYEASADPKRDFVAGQWQNVFGASSRPDVALIGLHPPADDVIDEGILLSGRSDSNWFHWLIEYLPRVLTAEGRIPDHVPVIVTSRTPSSGMRALEILSSRPVIVVQHDRSQTVRRLHVTAPPAQVLDSTRVPWSEGISMDPAPLLEMRDRLRRAAGVDSPATRRLFVRRKSVHRGLLNEAALADLAAERGFEVVEPSGMSFDEQVALFASAEIVVGASGAVMANYLVMSEGSHILALTSSTLEQFVLPAAIALVAGASFSYVTGPAENVSGRTKNDRMHSDFFVPEDRFAQALDEVLSERG